MKPACRRSAALLAVSILLPACSSFSSRTAPSLQAARINHVYVEHRLADGRHVDESIAAELRRRGYDASSGPSTMMPDGEDAIVTYLDSWSDDFTTYMIELDLDVRDAKSGVEIGTARYFKPSVAGTKPEQMIVKVLDKLFPPHVPPVASKLAPTD